MKKDRLRYDQMVEEALRGVVRNALIDVAEEGLPGDHHFYVTFQTRYPGVMIPDWLSTKYAQQMTIVLQHQFWGLEVEDEQFAVTLSFNNRHERLTIPFAAITGFADPAVSFGLQFENADDQETGQDTAPPSIVALPNAADPTTDPNLAKPDDKPVADGGAKVVTLDAFRKK